MPNPHIIKPWLDEVKKRVERIGTDRDKHRTRDGMLVTFSRKGHSTEQSYPLTLIDVPQSDYVERVNKGLVRIQDENVSAMFITAMQNWTDLDDILDMKADLYTELTEDPFFEVNGERICQDSRIVSMIHDYDESSDPLAIITTRLSVTFGMADGDPTVLR